MLRSIETKSNEVVNRSQMYVEIFITKKRLSQKRDSLF
jgi:hypothetical protein